MNIDTTKFPIYHCPVCRYASTGFDHCALCSTPLQSGDVPPIHMTNTKPSNPKDMVGTHKLPLNLVPDTLGILAAMSFAEGASKYGAYNWRAAGVRASIYYAAMRRHQKKWWNGEWADPVTKVPHLASVVACAAIIEDARLCGMLNDDRPPKADMARLIAEAEEVVLHVVKLNSDKNPHHYTELAPAP